MLEISRKSAQFNDNIPYEIFINDTSHGNIEPNETKKYPIDEGEHTIYAKVHWCRSKKIALAISSTQVNLEVGPQLSNRRLLVLFIGFISIILIVAYASFLNNRNLQAEINQERFEALYEAWKEANPLIYNETTSAHVAEMLKIALGIQEGDSRTTAAFAEWMTQEYLIEEPQTGGLLKVMLNVVGLAFTGIIIIGVLFITVFKNRYLRLRLC